jgi:selenocysteine lyase/cysteine desulfurase
LGAFPLDVRAAGVDAFYAGGAKWLLALPGVSFLYVSPALRERLAVRWRGWRDVADIWNFLDYEQPLAAGAARYEGGTQNFHGPGISSGIVTFTLPGKDPIALGRTLGRQGFVTTYRSSGMRVSPHGHNSAREIDDFLAALDSG